MKIENKVQFPWKFFITQFLILRVITLMAAWYGINFLPWQPTFPYWDAVLEPFGHPLYWSWANFDGVHYLMLAEKGYEFGLTQAFFPLYFLLIKIVTLVVQSRLLAALLISHVCFFGSMVMLYKLVKLDFTDKVAQHSVLFMTFFPTSFYFLSVYTESLFLFLLLSSFYLIRTSRVMWGGITGILLTLTRIVGICAVPAFVYEIWEQEKEMMKNPPAASRHTPFEKGGKYQKYFWAVLPSMGLLFYMWYLNEKFGDPMMFRSVQSGFGAGRESHKFVLLYQVFWRYLKMIFTVSFSSTLYYTIWMEFLSTLVALGLLVWAWLKNIRTSYLIFAFLAIILPTLTGTLSSMPRYILVAFPLFIVLGMIEKSWVRKVILGVSICLLIINTMLFTRGYWVG